MRIAQTVVDGRRSRLVVRRRIAVVERHGGRNRETGIQIDVCLYAGCRSAGTRRLRRTRQALCRIEQAQGYRGRASRNHAIDGGNSLEPQTLRTNDEAILVKLELAVAGIYRSAGTIVHLKEAAAVDCRVQRIVGDRNIALRKLLDNSRHLGPDAHRRTAGATQRRCEDVGKLRRTSLEANRPRVGYVVANGVKRLGRSVKATQTLLKSHVLLLLRISV